MSKTYLYMLLTIGAFLILVKGVSTADLNGSGGNNNIADNLTDDQLDAIKKKVTGTKSDDLTDDQINAIKKKVSGKKTDDLTKEQINAIKRKIARRYTS